MVGCTYSTIDFRCKFLARTSRGVLSHKSSSFLLLQQDNAMGIGECSTIPQLSIDPLHNYYQKLDEVCHKIRQGYTPKTIDLQNYPSIAFGLEMAWQDLHTNGSHILFESDFTKGKSGISINGLVWMGDKNFMQQQVREKIEAGYHCIKLKVGGIDFETELSIINNIRKQFSPADIEIRLDANRAFNPANAIEKLNALSAYHIHSIEQPIEKGQLEAMANLCSQSPIPIALDEELIGILSKEEKEMLIKKTHPSFLVLKPSLLGGFCHSEEWIKLAQENNIGWWVTSALESNIGLSAIAQWVSTLNTTLPQGLGTGQLYDNNFSSPLYIENTCLWYHPNKKWNITL